MKKFYLLSLLCSLCMVATAQITTAPIYANGASGSYTTGYAAVTPTRNDGTMLATGTAPSRRGYAVFNLASASIPANSTIAAVTVNFYATAPAGTAVCSTNVFVGDLSMVTVAGTLYNDMTTPLATNVSTATYGLGTSNRAIASTAAAVAVVQGSYAGKISYCFVNTGTALYTITGELGGTASPTAAGHAPNIIIDYCPPPTGVTATAAPTSLCAGDALTLTGNATPPGGGVLSYSWTGPGGYTGAGATPPAITTTTSSSGIYTLTAINTCGVVTASTTVTTASVTVNPLPSAISGPTNVCTGTAVALSDAGGATWSSSNTTVATVDISGNVFGAMSGTSTITYMDANGCYVTSPMAVNDPPGAISGPTQVCVGALINLTDPVGGGAWSSSAMGTATANAVTGDIGGVSSGSVFINYTIPGCAPASYTVSVNPIPAAITGSTTVCQSFSSTLTDTDPGGTWSSSASSIAYVSPTGILLGAASGFADITYTLPTGCYNTAPAVVNIVPAAFTGSSNVCVGSSTPLTETTPLGAWTTGNGLIATVDAAGNVGGVASGAAFISYTLVTGCYYTAPITVYALPPIPTGGTTVCQNATLTLTDADPGGTWLSSSTAAATVGSGSGTVTGVTAGPVNISYTALTGCISVAPITVNASPLSVITATGPTTFCAGGNVTLNSNIGAGYTYQWYNAGGPIGGATTSSIVVSTSGLFTVMITNVLSCSTMSAVTPVSAGIDAVITSSGPDSFCVGNHVILTTNTGGAIGAITYQWQLNGVNIPAAAGVSYYATQPGIYTSVASVSGGSGTCVVSSSAVNVAVYPLPTPTISFDGTAFSTPNTFTTYQWYVNTVGIPGATSYTYIPVSNGSYQVVVSDGNNCNGHSTAYLLNTVSVNKIVNNTSVSIYPNPASTVLHVESSVAVQAMITGLEGKTWMNVSNAKDIDISGLPGGLYLIRVYDEKGAMLMVQKLVKD